MHELSRVVLENFFRRQKSVLRGLQTYLKPGSHMPRPTWDIAAGTAWNNAATYVNIYCRHIICPRHSPPVSLRIWNSINIQIGFHESRVWFKKVNRIAKTMNIKSVEMLSIGS